jgi:hypothetical protein
VKKMDKHVCGAVCSILSVSKASCTVSILSKVPSKDSVTCKYIKQIPKFMSVGFANFTMMYFEIFVSFPQNILNLRHWAVIDPSGGVIC